MTVPNRGDAHVRGARGSRPTACFREVSSCGSRGVFSRALGAREEIARAFPRA
ncbi:hypothetical protein [Nonomuraea sp. NPDC048916]|uniref:hypothetical protein n=1 Tax=Nonomuraea sp. NPDC048916 TaxID=3154232 RepID=UPI0033C9F936